MVRLIASTGLLLALPALATVPPPLPPGALDTYKRVAAAPARDGIDKYLPLFSPTVSVIENGNQVVKNRDQWKAYLLNNLAWSVKHRLIGYGNPTLVADSVFLPSNGCCLHTRFAVYHFGDDGLVDEVRFTTGGTFWDGSLQP